MKSGVLSRGLLGLGILAASILTAAPSALANAQAADVCTAPPVSQPFLSVGDSNWYTLAPGQSADNFSATGWTLSGGAKVVTTTLADGTQGQVLDLPAGSVAVSAQMCVTNDYPFVRANVQNVSGPSGIGLAVAYTGTQHSGATSAGTIVGKGNGWTTTNRISIHPGAIVGWQFAQFTFTGGKSNEYRLYNFWVDPRMH